MGIKERQGYWAHLGSNPGEQAPTKGKPKGNQRKIIIFFSIKIQHQDDEGIMQWWAKQETENSKHSDVDDDSACADVPVVP